MGRDGRLLTEQGVEEIYSALVQDKVGLALSRIEMQTLQTTFNWKKKVGLIPVNVTLFPIDKFNKALSAMTPIFKSSICTGNRVIIVRESKRLGEIVIPHGKIGFGTVSSALFNGVLLKSGIPMESPFGGILQVRNHKPLRFVDLVYYTGSSLDPSEIFIRGKMTSVAQTSKEGNGRILANFREIPSIFRTIVEETVIGLREANLNFVLEMGQNSEPICEIPVQRNKTGMVLISGMNPIAAAGEAGIQIDSKAMSTVVDYRAFTMFESLLN